MGDFIGKHIPYHSEGPGSQLVDGGIELLPPHIVQPHELISDKHYHVYVKYGYAQAYIKNSSDLEYWKTLYIKMQEDKGRIPNLNGFNQLIISMLRDGFNPDLVHEIIWVPYDKVDKTLSYPNLIQFWNDIKPLVKKALYEDTKDFLIQK